MHIDIKTETTYSKTCLKRPIKQDQKKGFKTDYRLMQVQSIAECSHWSILQYLWPSLSYHLSLRYLFCLFLSGRLRQVLLFILVLLSVFFIRDQNHFKHNPCHFFLVNSKGLPRKCGAYPFYETQSAVQNY